MLLSIFKIIVSKFSIFFFNFLLCIKFFKEIGQNRKKKMGKSGGWLQPLFLILTKITTVVLRRYYNQLPVLCSKCFLKNCNHKTSSTRNRKAPRRSRRWPGHFYDEVCAARDICAPEDLAIKNLQVVKS